MLNGSPISGKGRTGADQPSCFVNAHRDHDHDFDDVDNENDVAEIGFGLPHAVALLLQLFLTRLLDYPASRKYHP